MKRIKWFFAEFLVVVTGVLVAFALNSWWLNAKDAQKEASYLDEIVLDMKRSIDLIEDARDFQNRTTHAASNLLEVSYSDSMPSDTVLSGYAIEAMSYQPGGLIQGALLSLVNSGDLQLISSDSIKAELTALSGNLIDYESLRKHMIYEMLLPAFRDFSEKVSPFRVSLSLITDAQLEMAVVDSLLPVPSVDHFKRPEMVNWRKLYADPVFIDRLTFLYIAHLNLRRVHENALNELTTSLERIESFRNN